MAAHCWPILVSAILGAGPVAATPAPVLEPNVVETAGAPGEPRFPFDCPAPWLHGYIQETPAYPGFHSFHPYNYKHVLVQSQIVGGWGLSHTSPYSQQYWHRAHPAEASANLPQTAPTAVVPGGAWQPQP
jgi:hypothetical protein